MPLKRRTRIKGQGKQKSSKSKESSSDDTDRCTAEEIVSRLAKKYLLKSSTDTEQSDQKENERSAQKVVADPYDADLEISEVDTATSVDTASDMECLDAQPTPLSPSRRANISMTRSTRSKSTFEINKSLQRAKPPVRPSVAAIRESSATKREPQSHRGHRGESRKSSATPQRRDAEESTRTPREEHQSDGGMFVSPLATIPRQHLPKMNASDTSTPASAIGDIRSDLDDSCFGFDGLITPDPLAPISPVDPLSPAGRSGLSRSSLGLSDASHTTSSRGSSTSYNTVEPAKRKASPALDLSSLVPDSQQPVKKPRKKAVKSVKSVKIDSAKMAKMQEWAAHMAEEFEDIEMNYDLTIEG